jgi:hypothetical protein
MGLWGWRYKILQVERARARSSGKRAAIFEKR